MKGSFLFAQIPLTLSKTHTITLTSWTLLGSWKDTWSQDPGHLTLLVPDVTHYGCWLCHAFLPTPSHSGTGPSCELVVTGYITTMYTSAVHLYAVHSIGATLRPKLLTWVKWSMWRRKPTCYKDVYRTSLNNNLCIFSTSPDGKNIDWYVYINLY